MVLPFFSPTETKIGSIVRLNLQFIMFNIKNKPDSPALGLAAAGRFIGEEAGGVFFSGVFFSAVFFSGVFFSFAAAGFFITASEPSALASGSTGLGLGLALGFTLTLGLGSALGLPFGFPFALDSGFGFGVGTARVSTSSSSDSSVTGAKTFILQAGISQRTRTAITVGAKTPAN